MSISIFDVLKEMTQDQKRYDDQDGDYKKAYSQFMINRFCSSINLYMLPIASIDKYRVSDKVHHMYLTSFMHKKNHYFNYTAFKKPKDKWEDSIECICKYFEVGHKEARLYIDMMTDDQIKEISDMYVTR